MPGARDDRGARKAILSLVVAVLADAGADPEAPIEITLSQGGTTLSYQVKQSELPLLRVMADLHEMEANIVQALHEAGHELEAKALARRAGYKYTSRFRSALGELQKQGLLVHTLDGYRLSLPT